MSRFSMGRCRFSSWMNSQSEIPLLPHLLHIVKLCAIEHVIVVGENCTTTRPEQTKAFREQRVEIMNMFDGLLANNSIERVVWQADAADVARNCFDLQTRTLLVQVGDTTIDHGRHLAANVVCDDCGVRLQREGDGIPSKAAAYLQNARIFHAAEEDEMVGHPAETVIDRCTVSDIGFEIRIVAAFNIFANPCRPVATFGNRHKKVLSLRPLVVDIRLPSQRNTSASLGPTVSCLVLSDP